jgi:hypothetical protein
MTYSSDHPHDVDVDPDLIEEYDDYPEPESSDDDDSDDETED